MNKKRFFLLLGFLVLMVTSAFLIIQKTDIWNKERVAKSELIERDLDIVYGSDSANLTIFLFSSYNCSFCRKFYKSVLPELEEEYIKTGKVKLIIKHVALTNNESVINSLQLAACLNKYGNFEKLNELLLLEPKVVYSNEFEEVINDLIDKDEFVAECMYGGESEWYIAQNLGDFKKMKCTGTPTFVINNRSYKGFLDYPKFKQLVEKELAYTLQ
ncbi:MAG: thioredoxin domain-containing protein [Bacteroidales bacterium]|nr:thioredoxin domain-containing protein [Bacteroidales bacterium]